MTENENDSTIENQKKTLVHEQSLDSGRDIMHLRPLTTQLRLNKILDLFAVPLPILLIKLLSLLLVNLLVTATAANVAAV